MKIKLFNSLTKSKDYFSPIKPGKVTMYVCGPTVYSHPHLGNARSVVIYDVLFRLLKDVFKEVIYVRNITDVDDKINAAAKENKVSIKDLTQNLITIFHNNMDQLQVLRPTYEPRATDHIKNMISMIEILLKNEHAYESKNHILFDVEKCANYGKLSNRSLDEMIAGARIEAADYKRNPLDFVLWKPADSEDDISAIFDSPWGKGRPGWHIECSAMSHELLGNDFDIHGGGSDLKFPHHDNEIAQSTCAYPGSKHAKFWVHNGFLTVNGEKMSKSLGNFITVKDMLDKNIPGIVIRYLLLSTHYRKPFDFSDNVLDNSGKSIEKFYQILKEVSDLNLDINNQDNPYLKDIKEALADDLNTPLAFSVLHQIVKDYKKSDDQNQKLKLASNMLEALSFLGFYDVKYFNDLSKTKLTVDEKYILSQIELRRQAKIDKNWQLSDKIRDDLINDFGVVLEDKPGGLVEWRMK